MDDYTESRKMFSDRFYEIIAKHQLEISEIVFDYFAQLSKEDLQKIEEEIISYDSVKSIAKLRITAEISKFKTEAQAWKESQKSKNQKSETSTEKSQTVVFEEQHDYEEISGETQNIELEKDYSHLNPVRHRAGDFFVADIFNSPVMRDDIASMEFPIFALKPKDTKIIEFEINNIKTTIKPSVEIGRATIFDKDIWIYAISKLMQAKYEGKEINQTIRFTAYDYFHTTNRQTGGSQYQQFKEALDRLQGTNITTEIETGGIKQAKGFGLIDGWGVIEKDKRGRMLAVEIKLPDWLYRVVLNDEVKAISPDYFRLRKPIDRRIYEIVAKHIGRKNEWKIGLRKLYEKTGATMLLKEFRRNIQSLIHTNELPDFIISYEINKDNRDKDIVAFTRRMEVDEIALEAKKQNADLQKKRLGSRKKIIISDDFRQKLSSTSKYYPQFSNSGLLTDEFLKKCLKQYSEENILLVFEKCKQINFDRIQNPERYFLKVLKENS